MRVVSIARASAIASLGSSVAASYNNNESSNPHHRKPRYLAKAAKSSSEGSKSNKGSGSKSGKGSKGASTPTIPPSFDTFDDESSGAPTSNPTSAPTSVPTTCELTCNDDTFEVNHDGNGETAFYFGSGDEDAIAAATGRDSTLIYSGDMLLNDAACGDDELFLNLYFNPDPNDVNTALERNYDNTIEFFKGGLSDSQISYDACTKFDNGILNTDNCCVATITLRFNPCGDGLTCTLENDTCATKLNECTCESVGGGLAWGSCVTQVVPDGIKKGESEGIGFDPRAFELDEEEDLDFLMSMSMPTKDDVEKENVAEESTTADDNLDAVKSFWGW